MGTWWGCFGGGGGGGDDGGGEGSGVCLGEVWGCHAMLSQLSGLMELWVFTIFIPGPPNGIVELE